MQTSAWRECRLSRLLLGTVQFGMPYGIANRTGQPRYADVLAMVRAAVEGGVNCFDTAAAYGQSEEVLGGALVELGVAEQVVVMTKVKPLTADELERPDLAACAIEQSVADSRRRLKLDCIPVVLFHRTIDAAFVHVLEELQTRGWLRHIGVSCDTDADFPLELIRSAKVSALQLPANVLDPRHRSRGVFREAAAGDVAVFIRSVYLQGLLVMPEDLIPPVLREVMPVRQRLAAIADQAGMTMAELAMRFMLSQEGVTCVLAGVETIEQVQQNLIICNRGPLTADVLDAIGAAVPPLPEAIITPSLWPSSHYPPDAQATALPR